MSAGRSLWIAARAYGREDRHLASQLEGRPLGGSLLQGVEDDAGRLVAWAELYFPQDARGTVHPEMRGRGLGTYLLRWSERRAIEILRRRLTPRRSDGVRGKLGGC